MLAANLRRNLASAVTHPLSRADQRSHRHTQTRLTYRTSCLAGREDVMKARDCSSAVLRPGQEVWLAGIHCYQATTAHPPFPPFPSHTSRHPSPPFRHSATTFPRTTAGPGPDGSVWLSVSIVPCWAGLPASSYSYYVVTADYSQSAGCRLVSQLHEMTLTSDTAVCSLGNIRRRQLHYWSGQGIEGSSRLSPQRMRWCSQLAAAVQSEFMAALKFFNKFGLTNVNDCRIRHVVI